MATSFPKQMKRSLLLSISAFSFCVVAQCPAGEAPKYEELKGDALRTVLKPIPPKEPLEALRTLEVIKGFSVEFVAHEPLVLDPVAAAIDENGLMYVAEDADYPYSPEAGKKPLGRIRLLKDNDGDGYYEESHLFADGLLWPAGVAPWKGGVFVTAPPDIWYLKDTDGDGKADVREKVFTGFGMGGSQYVLNNLQWGIDHRIYASVAGNGGLIRRADGDRQTPIPVSRKDFRFDPVTKEFQSISGGRQFGNTFDDWGNRFLCSQDTALYQVVFPQHYLERNPFLFIPETTVRLVPAGAPIFRTSPIEVWRAIRSSRRLLAEKGSPEQSGVSHHVLDGVAGSTVYRGGAFPSEFYGNVFSGDAQNNLVHRRSLIEDGVLFRSERLDRGTEFLRSSDNWFRPVNFVNAPDGTLYVLDLAREVLEAVHIPMDVVSHLDLTSGRDRGRIYRVKPEGFQRPPQPKLGAFTTQQLVACLENPNVWWRETAHRLLFERQDKSAASSLRAMLEQSRQPQARLLALWSLSGLGLLSDHDILAGLSDSFPAIRENSVKLAEPRIELSSGVFAACLKLATDENPRVRFQLAFTLGESKDIQAMKALSLIAKKSAANSFIRTAALSSSYHCASEFLSELLRDSQFVQSNSGREIFEELSRIVGGRNRAEEIATVLEAALHLTNKNAQRAVVLGLSDGLRMSGAQLATWTKALDAFAAKQLDSLTGDALQVIENSKAGTDEINSALPWLECASAERSSSSILKLLDRFPPATVQVTAVRTLSRMNAVGLEDALLMRWRKVNPEARKAILSAFLTRRERLGALLKAVEDQRILRGEVDAATRASLRGNPDALIRNRAAILWGKEMSDSRKEAIDKFRPALGLTGKAEAGQSVFQQLCSSCHRLNGLGNEIGPNLALSATRSPDELLTHILDPNLSVDPAYVQYTIATQDDESYAGIIVSDNAGSVTLKGVNFQKTIPRSQVKSLTSGGLSLMPVGLEAGMSLEDMANLLSFLMSSQYDYGTSGHSYARDVPEQK